MIYEQWSAMISPGSFPYLITVSTMFCCSKKGCSVKWRNLTNVYTCNCTPSGKQNYGKSHFHEKIDYKWPFENSYFDITRRYPWNVDPSVHHLSPNTAITLRSASPVGSEYITSVQRQPTWGLLVGLEADLFFIYWEEYVVPIDALMFSRGVGLTTNQRVS